MVIRLWPSTAFAQSNAGAGGGRAVAALDDRKSIVEGWAYLNADSRLSVRLGMYVG